MGTSHLCKFSKKMFQLALGHTCDEDELSLLDRYRRSKGYMRKVELLKRLYAEDQIEEIYQELWVESDAEAYYCYVCADEVLASCHTFHHENIQAYPLVRWDYENLTQIRDSESSLLISQKKEDGPFRLVQIEGVFVSESHRNKGICTSFLKEVLVQLRSRSVDRYLYISAEGDNLPAKRCYEKVFEYSGSEHPWCREHRYWIVK